MKLENFFFCEVCLLAISGLFCGQVERSVAVRRQRRPGHASQRAPVRLEVRRRQLQRDIRTRQRLHQKASSQSTAVSD